MKRVKRIASFLLAMVMVLGMGLTALAEQEGTLKISGAVEGKSYDLYRVFDLTYSEGNPENDTTPNYSYTVNADFKGFFEQEEIKKAMEEAGKEGDPVGYVGTFAQLTYAENATDDEKAEVDKTNQENAQKVSELAQKLLAYATEWTGTGEDQKQRVEPIRKIENAKPGSDGMIEVKDLPYGYYLLNPLGGSVPTGEYATMFALNTLSGKDMTINVKANYPTIDKTVMDDNETEPDKTDEISIGKEVTFRLLMKVPDTTGYNKYWFVIDDELSAGLTFGEITSIKMGNIVEKKDEEGNVTGEEFEEIVKLQPAAGENEGDYSVAKTFWDKDEKKIDNPDAEGAPAIAKTKIKIVFNDFLNYITSKKVPAGTDIEVLYTATLNENAVVGGTEGNKNKVTLTYSNNPKHNYGGNEPGPDDDKVTGKTPESKTETFTTSLTINKIDGETKKAFKGAKFKISGSMLDTVITTGEVYTPAADGDWYKLKDGTYTKTEPTEQTKAQYDGDGAQKYKQETKVTQKTTGDNPVNAEAYVNAEGKLTFAGLGAGEYRISEVVAPNGYNAIADFPVRITFDQEKKEFKAERGEYQTVDGQETAVYPSDSNKEETKGMLNSDKNVITMTVENNSGIQLPSTGGMGTTIFYVLGGILVLGAGVLLVTRRKMSAEK